MSQRRDAGPHGNRPGMTRGLALPYGIAALLATAGLTLLIRPALFRVAGTEAATYASRILGAMLFAAALFLAGFSTAYSLAVAP